MTLNLLEIGQVAKIKKVAKNSELYQRFLDIGIIEGSTIECVLISPWNNPKAYRVKGTTIAIRNEDAKAIEIVVKEAKCNEPRVY